MDLRQKLSRALSPNLVIEREVEGGGMARVFVARDTTLGRRVVVKTLPPELAATVSIERFRREVLICAHLQHPHIVPVLASGEYEGLLFYSMPLVEGESLRALLSREGAISPERVIAILRDVTMALAHAHRKGVLHRDIKPGNIISPGTRRWSSISESPRRLKSRPSQSRR